MMEVGNEIIRIEVIISNNMCFCLKDHEFIECSRCRCAAYAGAICRNCDKNAAEIFKKEHSCFVGGTGDVVVISSDHTPGNSP